MNPETIEKDLQKPKKLRDKLKENNAITKAASVVSLILILAGLFAFIITGLDWLDLLVLPEFVQDILFHGRGESGQVRMDDSDIYDYLNSSAAESGGVAVEISLETVRGIISVINMPDNLYLESTAKYYIDGAPSRTADMALWKKAGKYRYIISSGGVLEELYINDGRYELVENYLTGSYSRRTGFTDFSFANVPHITDINYYLDLIDSGVITDYNISREAEGSITDINNIEIIYNIEELDQREELLISLESGLVLSVRSYAGGELFYESAANLIEAYFTGSEPENTVLTDSLFAMN